VRGPHEGNAAGKIERIIQRQRRDHLAVRSRHDRSAHHTADLAGRGARVMAGAKTEILVHRRGIRRLDSILKTVPIWVEVEGFKALFRRGNIPRSRHPDTRRQYHGTYDQAH